MIVETVEAENGKDKKTGRFVTGNSGGGRPKGSRNKLGEAFLDDLYADWKKNGAQALKDCRTDNPAAYVKVVASILPKQVEVKTDGISEMSDDELERLINIVRTADSAAVAPGKREEKASSQNVIH
jgi:hypothetical protein